ncbi:uncharacterized protein LOC115228649 [Octopus sinensis]|uniref:Uncharacterized protein LOC115228649 n=1 Tax=Octopus sinensis TaxID=2607531 RepID=A0A6P7TS35_9MOLL|nr:uncharacterized protein LOC115228649 [Octopus sinensis]
MADFLENYLRNGEISKFIDRNVIPNSSLHLSFENSSSHRFINEAKKLDFPVISDDSCLLYVQVEWLPLRRNLIKCRNVFHYHKSSFENTSESQIIIFTPIHEFNENKTDIKRPNISKSTESSQQEDKHFDFNDSYSFKNEKSYSFNFQSRCSGELSNQGIEYESPIRFFDKPLGRMSFSSSKMRLSPVLYVFICI